jgi:ribosomal protein L15
LKIIEKNNKKREREREKERGERGRRGRGERGGEGRGGVYHLIHFSFIQRGEIHSFGNPVFPAKRFASFPYSWGISINK